MSGGGRVRFNVGGKAFETTTTTLAAAGRNSLLGAILDESWNAGPARGGGEDRFIDRNPACFGVLLDLLRTGELHLPPDVPERLLFREAMYYGLLDHVRAARWGPLDGNRLRLVAAVEGHAPGDGTAVRASPDGGCCVAHGSLAHVYNWTLEEHQPISLDYQRINDLGYLDATHVVVAACERLGTPDGGMALFSAPTGELRHRFQVTHDGQVKTFTAGALCFNDATSKLFASCKGRCNEYGVGAWDPFTGQQLDFFYEPPGASLGDADRLQFLPSSGYLMVATLFPKTDNCYIGFLDFRAPPNRVAWSWSDAGSAPASLAADEKRVLDAVAIEDSSSICVVNQYDDLGFMDLRGGGGSGGVRWSSRSRLMKGKGRDEELCYPKLAVHGGQLFCSMNDGISVFCGPEWVLTARLRNTKPGHCHGGSICDFSIGGDRLFTLHSEENLVDVWESPPYPMI